MNSLPANVSTKNSHTLVGLAENWEIKLAYKIIRRMWGGHARPGHPKPSQDWRNKVYSIPIGPREFYLPSRPKYISILNSEKLTAEFMKQS